LRKLTLSAFTGGIMRCGEARKLLSSYIDDALDLSTTRIVSMHLKRCGECNRQYDELRALSVFITQSNNPERDLALEQRLFNTVKAAQETPTLVERITQAFRFDWRTASAAGAIVVAIAMFVAGGPTELADYANTYANVSSKVVTEEVESSRSFWGNVFKESCERISSVSRQILGSENERQETNGETASENVPDYVAMNAPYACVA
jgi:hypothetical protein